MIFRLKERYRENPSSYKDMIIIFGLFVLSFIISLNFHIFEIISEIGERDTTGLHELIPALIILPFAIVAFAYRRWEELRSEKKMRKSVDEGLQNTLFELEDFNREFDELINAIHHHLQEPLRMMSSYVQLLDKKYKGKLDSDADEFIAYAVDGAENMKAMINDLLTYSKVNVKGRPFKTVSSEKVLEAALNNLGVSIMKSGAEITHDPLPEVTADESQLYRLFSNLIDNAIKFREEKTPKVHVSAEEKEGELVFSVRDNGIGIEKKFQNRIFKIFETLQGKDKYMGSGIGLSVAKRIVNRHGGSIRVKSRPGKGSTFYFTLPKTGGKNNGRR